MRNHVISERRFGNKIQTGLPRDPTELNASHANAVVEVLVEDAGGKAALLTSLRPARLCAN